MARPYHRGTSYVRSLWASASRQLRRSYRRNVATICAQPMLEISGAFADLGTFLPLFLSLSVQGAISAPATLVISGTSNIVIGSIWGLPLPVQPMKALAAAAIAADLGASETAGAGLFMGGALAVLTLSGALSWSSHAVPRAIIRGIQAGAGLSLIISAFGMHHQDKQSWSVLSFMDWVLLVTAVLLLALATCFPKRVPYVLILLVASIAVPPILHTWHPRNSETLPGDDVGNEIWQPHFQVPASAAFLRGTFVAGLGQLPLTVLNSVLAVVQLAQDLYPSASDGRELEDEHTETDGEANFAQQPALPSATGIGISLAITNLLGPWLGAMPICHGSGGLAAQHRFGARSGASVIILGILKILLGGFASGMVQIWAESFPAVWRGMLVFLAGVELAAIGVQVDIAARPEMVQSVAGSDASAQIQYRRALLTMLVTAGTALGTHNMGIGFVVGRMMELFYAASTWVHRWQDARGAEGRVYLSDDPGA